ncbi:unnamed protein product [Phytophthora lilii]|uniref:Unnamed protein product n=1 Tax=Phytophthora lilii TaxID=2077276 RepID=A0A9W7CVX1_9STRA|nr:unnamed protein product [Phytophthora lilii]
MHGGQHSRLSSLAGRAGSGQSKMKSKASLQATTTATIEETQSWSSVVLKDTLTLEHAAVDINTDRVLYHLHLELENPIPEPYLANADRGGYCQFGLQEAASWMLAAAESNDLPPTLFPWKMQLGKWGHNKHWFLRDIVPPQNDRPGPLTAHLMAGFSTLEVQIEVNSITSVDTVGQTFTADVTWEFTMPAILSIREDSMLRELLDILEFDESEF